MSASHTNTEAEGISREQGKSQGRLGGFGVTRKISMNVLRSLWSIQKGPPGASGPDRILGSAAGQRVLICHRELSPGGTDCPGFPGLTAQEPHQSKDGSWTSLWMGLWLEAGEAAHRMTWLKVVLT